MPRVRRKTKSQRRIYNGNHIEQLLNGHDFFGGGFGDGDYAVADMRQAWPVLRKRVFQVLLERNTPIRPWA